MSRGRCQRVAGDVATAHGAVSAISAPNVSDSPATLPVTSKPFCGLPLGKWTLHARRPGRSDPIFLKSRLVNGSLRHFFERSQRFGQGLTAINDERLPGNIPGLIGCEEQYRVSDVFNRP